MLLMLRSRTYILLAVGLLALFAVDFLALTHVIEENRDYSYHARARDSNGAPTGPR